jgi:hypothetical protein
MSVAVSTVQLNKAITRAVDDYRNGPSQWIADYVAPRISVPEKTGYLPRFGRFNQKDISGKVSPFAPSPKVDYDISTTEFECEVYRKRADLPYELEVFDNTGLLRASSLSLSVAEAMQIEREREIATMLVDTTNSVTAQSAPTTRWDTTGGDPAEDVATAISTIDDAINRIPGYGLCTRDVALFLRRHVASLRAGGGSIAMASLPEVADFLGLSELRVMRAGYDSAKPGDTSVGAKVIAANKFWVFHKPQNMSMFAPSWASTPYIPKLSQSRGWSINDPQGMAVEVRDCRDLVVVDKTACVYIATPLT